MKTKFVAKFLCLFILVISASCQKDTPIRKVENSIDLISLENQINQDLQNISSYSNPQAYFDEQYSSVFNNQYDQIAFYSQFGTVKNENGRSFSQSSVLLSKKVVNVLENIGEIMDTSSGFNDLITELDLLSQGISRNTELDTKDKEFLLTYIVVFKVSMNHLLNNTDLANGRTAGWWSSWGKCAAGVIGGGLTGAVTLGLGGAAVGTVVLPIIETVSAGVVGAVVGGIGGALTDAAAACNEPKILTNDYDPTVCINNYQVCYDPRAISLKPGISLNDANFRSISTLSSLHFQYE